MGQHRAEIAANRISSRPSNIWLTQSEQVMHPATRFQFERAAREYADWREVPEDERSPAPAWWWQTALEV